MANRYLPFGYCITNGSITIIEDESSIVKAIYQMYAKGQSYLSIAKHLTSEKISYTAEKNEWNKNMIARILQNKKYLGDENYPKIIEDEMLRKTQISAKTYTHTMSKDMKNIKPLLICKCGESLCRRINRDGTERWYCPNDIEHISVSLTDEKILAQIQTYIKSISIENTLSRNKKVLTLDLIKLNNKLDLLMESENINPSEIIECLKAIATEKYNSLADTNYREKQILKELQNSTNLNADLLKEICSQIIIFGDKVTEIKLKGE